MVTLVSLTDFGTRTLGGRYRSFAVASRICGRAQGVEHAGSRVGHAILLAPASRLPFACFARRAPRVS